MKKSVLLIVLGVGLVLVSCEKQAIQPRTNANVEDAPVWEPSTAPLPSASTTAPSTSTTGTTVTNSAGGDDSDSGGITDPNDDEDGNGRKKV